MRVVRHEQEFVNAVTKVQLITDRDKSDMHRQVHSAAATPHAPFTLCDPPVCNLYRCRVTSLVVSCHLRADATRRPVAASPGGAV